MISWSGRPTKVVSVQWRENRKDAPSNMGKSRCRKEVRGQEETHGSWRVILGMLDKILGSNAKMRLSDRPDYTDNSFIKTIVLDAYITILFFMSDY